MTINHQNGAKLNQSFSPASQNGNGNGAAPANQPKFDQPVILQQPAFWSRAIVWSIAVVTTASIIWACVAKIEEAVPAQGKLEPQGAVKEVQAPVAGVVKEVYVKEGDRVEQGEPLLAFDPTAAQAQEKSLTNIRTALMQENQFYRAQLSGVTSPDAALREAIALKLPGEIASLTKSRATLLAENELYRAQLSGATRGGNFSADQLARLQSSRSESDSRAAAAQFEIRQLEQQSSQNQVALANAKDSLAVNTRILDDIRPLYEQGGIARIQYLKQEQEVRTGQAEVERLTQENQRLRFAIAQAQEQLQNTVSLSQKDVLTQMSENEKRIAEIDSQLTKAVVENEKRIDEINSQLSQAQLTLKYQEVKAPSSGIIFDMKAGGPGFVANPSEPVMKIVPADNLVAKVYITNRDIGFIREDMDVDVRIDSFPFNEFGDIKGKLIWIGSDALPPDEIRPYYSFPAKIRLNAQTLDVNGKPVILQSGMSVTTNIKIRKRTVMSIFINLFAKQLDGMKSIR